MFVASSTCWSECGYCPHALQRAESMLDPRKQLQKSMSGLLQMPGGPQEQVPGPRGHGKRGWTEARSRLRGLQGAVWGLLPLAGRATSQQAQWKQRLKGRKQNHPRALRPSWVFKPQATESACGALHRPAKRSPSTRPGGSSRSTALSST